MEFYLDKPLQLNLPVENQRLKESDLGKSISNYLELIIFTRKGEHRFNADFGCAIWDLDFELIVSESLWEEKFRKSLLDCITRYEWRIAQVVVKVNISEVETFFPKRKVAEIKKKVMIYVEGKMVETGERYAFSTSLFLSPLAK